MREGRRRGQVEGQSEIILWEEEGNDDYGVTLYNFLDVTLKCIEQINV